MDQLLHALRAVNGVPDKFLGVGVECGVVPLGQQLQVAGDLAQGLLQVVRGDVGELL